jgi:hypothetical protein
MTKLLLALAGMALSTATLVSDPIKEATCKSCPATYIGHEELQQYHKRAVADRIIGAERRPATNTNVRLLNGPGHNAKSVRNGVTHLLKAGDVLVIPAGTGHWFTKIDDHITYLMIRVDPDKVTPLKDEAASKADLAGKK